MNLIHDMGIFTSKNDSQSAVDFQNSPQKGLSSNIIRPLNSYNLVLRHMISALISQLIADLTIFMIIHYNVIKVLNFLSHKSTGHVILSHNQLTNFMGASVFLT